MTDERRFTLDEAERELAQRECLAHGHSLDTIVVLGSSDPAALVCSRCGRSWRVLSEARAGWWIQPAHEDLVSVHHALRVVSDHPRLSVDEQDVYRKLADELWEGYFGPVAVEAESDR